MAQTFVEFIVDSAKEWTPEQKAEVVQMLRDRPDTLKSNILENISDWAAVYCVKSKSKVMINDSHEAADEIISGWRKTLQEDSKMEP